MSILKVLHCIISAFDRTSRAWVFLDKHGVSVCFILKLKGEKSTGNTSQAAHPFIACHATLDGEKEKTLRCVVVSTHLSTHFSGGTLANNSNATATPS